MPKASKTIARSPQRRAAAKPTHDPIFAAIDEHRRLKNLFFEECCGDAEGGPSAHQDRIDRADEAATHAANAMARIRPTTAPGCSALLRYVLLDPVTGVLSDEQIEIVPWQERALRTAAAALAEIARQTEPA